MFGKLVGAGQAGFVFEKASNPNHYYKIVPLGMKPLAEYGLNSLQASIYAINRNQALMYYYLSKDKSLDLPQLPKIYSFYQGAVNPKLRQNFLRNNETDNPHLNLLMQNLPVGQKIAVWEMEKIPCLTENDYCNLYDKLPPEQNQDYQKLLSTLLDLGFVVRDIANPENFGYRNDGTQVFFDPIVAPWPTTEADKFLQPARYESFVASFGSDQIPTIARSIANGDYFTWYHGGGVMESETEESDLPTDLDFEKLYSVLANTALWDNKQYPMLETLNWFNPTYQKVAQEQAEHFWTTYYNNLGPMLHPFFDDLNMIAAEETIHETLWKVEELIYNYYAEITPENIISKTDTLAKELTKLETYDEDVWYDWESPMLPANDYGHYYSTFASPTVFFKARDKVFKQTLKNIVGQIELQCGECDGEGIITHSHDDYDKEYNEWCDSCSEGTVTVGDI